MKKFRKEHIQSQFEMEMAQIYEGDRRLLDIGREKVDFRISGKLGLNNWEIEPRLTKK